MVSRPIGLVVLHILYCVHSWVCFIPDQRKGDKVTKEISTWKQTECVQQSKVLIMKTTTTTTTTTMNLLRQSYVKGQFIVYIVHKNSWCCCIHFAKIYCHHLKVLWCIKTIGSPFKPMIIYRMAKIKSPESP